MNLPLGGIPDGITFMCVFAAIDPQRFTECMTASVASAWPELPGQLVPTNGKSLRGSCKADDSTI
jgi:hypothetical protein